MQIDRIDPPINGGSLYTGFAQSTRGRRYLFMASADGDGCAFRECQDGFWMQVTSPAGLKSAVRARVRTLRCDRYPRHREESGTARRAS
jgi:hypothetical protein